MANIKSYTDIEQSRKLAEILPIESADMCYIIDYAESNIYGTDHFKLEVDTYGLEAQKRDNIPCWSLASLLDVLPNGIIMNKDSQNGKYHFSSTYVGTHITADNPVDACYELIIKLKELNLL